jgi:hypothetical protein
VAVVGVGDASFGNTDGLSDRGLDPTAGNIQLEQDAFQLAWPQPFEISKLRNLDRTHVRSMTWGCDTEGWDDPPLSNPG